jgi:3-deoxy-manno-octulosonate cytidylyltransferase (CMP-KDO synthetase)
MTQLADLLAAHDAVLFDFDGVLCHSEPVFHRTFNAAIEPLGLHVPWDRYIETFVHGATSVEAWLAGPHAAQAEAVGDRWRAGLAAAARAGEVAVDRELIASIRASSRPVAVATSSTPWWVATVLGAAGLEAPCPVIARAGGLRKKPHPDVYVHAAGRLGVAPDRCVAIEDAAKGVAAARAVGMHVVVVRTDHGEAAYAAADTCVDRGALLAAMRAHRPRCVAVIPARYASTRFPGKPLALIDGRPMIEHVWRRATQARSLDAVLVATDDARIADVCRAFGAEVVPTRADHATGTDRVAEALTGRTADVVVNVQGDEPLLDPAAIDAMVADLIAHPAASFATIVHPMAPDAAHDPDRVKAIRDAEGWALWFSRATIPFERASVPTRWQHAGVYAWRRAAFDQVAHAPQTPSERAESLEQLRALETGHRARAVAWPSWTPCSVDRPEDVAIVEERIRATVSYPR